MDVEATGSQDRTRSEFQAWLAANWDRDLSLLSWRERLVDSGWAKPSWPRRCFGRELPEWSEAVISEEMAAAGTVGPVLFGTAQLAPHVLLEYGDDSVRSRYLRPILTGLERWCQLFSEPSAGSDLASLSTTANEDGGGGWVVSGQKLWTSGAQRADFALLLARTGAGGDRHRALTMMILPMRQVGVKVRPLLQMNGHQTFYEVYLDRASVPASHTLGEVGAGWTVARSVLTRERSVGAFSRPTIPAGEGRVLAEARSEIDEQLAAYAWYPQRTGRAELLIETASAAGRSDDPVIRQALARIVSLQRIQDWTSQRYRQTGSSAHYASVSKLALSRISRESAALHALLAGPAAVAHDPGAEGLVAEIITSVPAQSIAGGTDQIQRNVMAERLLGLPRES